METIGSEEHVCLADIHKVGKHKYDTLAMHPARRRTDAASKGNPCEYQEKHSMGLRQMGIHLIAVPSLQQMLEIVFNILEGSYLCY